MEFLNLPLRIVVSLWLIQRLGKPEPASFNIVKHLDSEVAYIDKVMRIENPLQKTGWIERKLRKIVHKYRKMLRKEADALHDLNVVQVGFIPKE